jgi:hypothetical protein
MEVIQKPVYVYACKSCGARKERTKQELPKDWNIVGDEIYCKSCYEKQFKLKCTKCGAESESISIKHIVGWSVNRDPSREYNTTGIDGICPNCNEVATIKTRQRVIARVSEITCNNDYCGEHCRICKEYMELKEEWRVGSGFDLYYHPRLRSENCKIAEIKKGIVPTGLILRVSENPNS